MGTRALRIPIAIAALFLASVAPAQPRSGPWVPKSLYSYTVVPLYDRAGNVMLYISYADGPDGKREIRFDDGTVRPIIRIFPQSPPAGSSNPLFGLSIPPLPDTSPVNVPNLASGRSGLADGRSDTNSELRFLVDRVNQLTGQIDKLTRTLNALAARP
jgi:hypothetical protein